jgi:hypothetical protein
MCLNCILLFSAREGFPPDKDILENGIVSCKKAGCEKIYVLTDCDVSLPARSDVLVHCLPDLGMENTLPEAIWIKASECLTSCISGPVLLLDCRCANLSEDDITGFAESARETKDSIVSVRVMRDHPCQLNEYFDVVASIVYLGRSGDDRTTLHRHLSFLSEKVFVSIVFSWPWDEYGLNTDSPGLFELQYNGGVPIFMNHNGTLKPNGVYFWRRSSDSARQVVASSEQLSAVPLGLPYHLSPLILLESAYGATVWSSERLALPHMVQLSRLSEIDPHDDTALDRKEVVSLNKERLFSGSKFKGEYQLSLPQNSLFLLNVLVPSRLPHADVEWPHRLPKGIWKVDPATMVRYDSISGKQYLQRQDMPEFFEIDGCLALFSEISFKQLGSLGFSHVNVRPVLTGETR